MNLCINPTTIGARKHKFIVICLQHGHKCSIPPIQCHIKCFFINIDVSFALD